MKKPLSIAMAVLSAGLTAAPVARAEDTPNPSATLAQLTAMMQNDGWQYDTSKKVFTKNGQILYVQGDGASVAPTPPSQQQAPPKANAKKAGLKTGDVPPSKEDPHVIKPEAGPTGFLNKLEHNQTAWMFGGGIAGAIILGLIGGPIGFLVGGLGGMIAGNLAFNHIAEKKK